MEQRTEGVLIGSMNPSTPLRTARILNFRTDSHEAYGPTRTHAATGCSDMSTSSLVGLPRSGERHGSVEQQHSKLCRRWIAPASSKR